MEPIRYWIDDLYVIVRVNDAWDAFACSNDAPELTRHRVVGRGLWDFIADHTTRLLYDRMIVQAKHGRDVRFGFRCDAPEWRRDLEMIVAQDEGLVRFETHLVRETMRDPQFVRPRDPSRPDELLRACSWCNRIEHEGEWLEIEAAVAVSRVFDQHTLPHLTHGICPDCVARIEATLDLAAADQGM